MNTVSLICLTAATALLSSCVPSPLIEREVSGYSISCELNREDRTHHISKRKAIQFIKTSEGLKIDPRFNYVQLLPNKVYSHIIVNQQYDKNIAEDKMKPGLPSRILKEEWPSVRESTKLLKSGENTLILTINIGKVEQALYSSNADGMHMDKDLILHSYILKDADTGNILARAKYLGVEPYEFKGELPGLREFIRFTTEKDPLAQAKFQDHELFSETWRWKTALNDYYILYKKESKQLQQEKGYAGPLKGK